MMNYNNNDFSSAARELITLLKYRSSILTADEALKCLDLIQRMEIQENRKLALFMAQDATFIKNLKRVIYFGQRFQERGRKLSSSSSDNNNTQILIDIQ